YMTDGTATVWSEVYNFTLTGFNDFEATDNAQYLYNWQASAWNTSTNSATPTIWQWGQPTAGPSAAHSGTYVVGTNLSGYYGVNYHVDALITPWIDLTNASWVTLSFYAWYDLENTYDGLLIAYQNDSSSTLYQLDPNNNASQYDNKISTSYNSPIAGLYAFTGSTSSWVQKSFNTSTINDPTVNKYLLGHKVRFIFYFASDESVNNHYGFYFDDIQVKAGIPVYHIYGYVKDANGNPVSNATVWVNDTTLGISYKVVTDTNGEYNVYTYNGMNGDTISVDAMSGAQKGSNSGTMGSSTANTVQIDITFSAVPEFSWYAPIFILLGMLVLLRRRNKH
ncbi:MAG: peptidase S53, partial [Euryarchaeota archaeon]|nr:peptidase S53 [Euryarchaeota archaeon]